MKFTFVSKNMKKWGILCIILASLAGCESRKRVPDVSGISVRLELQRFEEDFFSIDSIHPSRAFSQLRLKYPIFLDDFIQNILGLPLSDSGTATDSAISLFLHDYRLVKETSKNTFNDPSKMLAELKRGIQFTKYYFPQYHAPEKLITFIGPIDAVFETPLGKLGDVITRDALAVGLQLHLGHMAALYQSQTAQTIFPSYISRRFTPEYIPVNCMRNIIDDIFPDQTAGKTLLDQMVDKGKRLYVLGLLLPETADSMKIGYTKKQLDGCYSNEGLIWNFFLQNDLIYNSDYARIQNYISEGPNTQEFGDDSPGFIGLFIGWQIVKTYMEKFPETRPLDLFRLDARQILTDSKYKPR